MNEREKIIEELRKTNEISKDEEKILLTHSDVGFWINISMLHLTQTFLREHKDDVDWEYVSRIQELSEDSIREFKDYVKWGNISIYQKLSEALIRKFKDRVNWDYISRYQKLSESFIEEMKEFVNWTYISIHQKLSENFIREFKDYVKWGNISIYQKLSETLIREFRDRVNWDNISKYQKLDETFIRKFQDCVNWKRISVYQKLSESFIEEMKEYVSWICIIDYQVLSETFRKKYKVLIHPDNWLYKDASFKKEQVRKTKMYLCHDDYFIAYKGIRDDRYSNYNFQYQYLPNETYSSHADCTNNSNSFGLSVWTKEEARFYCNELVIKVKVCYEDVARIVHEGGKIRCSKFTILD